MGSQGGGLLGGLDGVGEHRHMVAGRLREVGEPGRIEAGAGVLFHRGERAATEDEPTHR